LLTAKAAERLGYGEPCWGRWPDATLSLWPPQSGSPPTASGASSDRSPCRCAIRCKIGYGRAEGFRGRTYGTELVGAMTKWLLAQPGIQAVRASTLADKAPAGGSLSAWGVDIDAVAGGCRSKGAGPRSQFETGRAGAGPNAAALVHRWLPRVRVPSGPFGDVGEAALEESLLGPRLGELEGACVCRARFSVAAEASQQVGARRVVVAVFVEL